MRSIGLAVFTWYRARPSDVQVQTLLGSGVDAAYQDPSDGRSAMMAAAAEGHSEIVKALLAAGAPWNAFDRQANCAGDYALAGQHEECVEVLLNAGEVLKSAVLNFVYIAIMSPMRLGHFRSLKTLANICCQ